VKPPRRPAILKFEREFAAKIAEAKVRLAPAQKRIEKLRAAARKARGR
jgi:hypothetical protein